MKITAAAVLALCTPSLSFALVGNGWKFQSAPADGLNDVTFPFNIAKAPHKSGYYFAQQFSFQKVSEVGFTGLQPRRTRREQRRLRDILLVPGRHYDHTYNLVVKNTIGATWRGTLVDTVTRRPTVVGEWTLPNGAGKLVNGQVGFVEYYYWIDQGSHACSSLPFTEATFYNPTSETKGASGGQITSVFEYGDCAGTAGYSATKLAGGYDIKVGF